MKISTEIASAARIIGEEKAIEYYGKAGFDAWDFSMFDMVKYDWGKKICLPTDHPLASPNYLAFARRLKQVGLDNGMVCNQSHAPFPTACAEIRSFYKRAIECTAEAGGRICVIHPNNYEPAQVSAEMYWELLPFAKECGVTGSRIMGGGFGGCTINLVRKDMSEKFVECAKSRFYEKYGHEPQIYPVVISDGARKLE